MKRWIYPILLLLCGSISFAQTTTVNATVVDTDGTAWAGGTWKIEFIPNTAMPDINIYNQNGVALIPTTMFQNGALNGSGAFSVTIYTSNTVSPAGSSLKLTVCPNASAPCGVYNFSTTSTSPIDISSALTAVIPPPRFNADPSSYGYNDGEAKLVIPGAGQYTNVSIPCPRFYIGGVWTCISTGTGGSVIPGQLAVAIYSTTTGNTLSPSPSLTYDAATGTKYSAPSFLSALTPVADVTNPTYGAVGDDVHDDAPAARAALAAVMAQGGGTVYFPKGTFRLSTDSSVSANFVFYAQGSHIHFKCDPEAVLDATDITTSFAAGLFAFGYPTVAQGGMQNNTGYPANVLSQPGSPTITITTPSNTSHFAVGDPIFILGGPGFESNGDGEINWITAIDSVGGVLTLQMPTSKPYTGNLTNVGTPNIVTVIPGIDHSVSPALNRFYEDDSLEGCRVTNLQVDLVYMGQVLHGKILNNRAIIVPTATRGMLMNDAFPMSDIEIAGNYYVQGAHQPFSQLATGMRDLDIHDNVDISPYGAININPSEGVINTHIHHNRFYVNFPTGLSGNLGSLVISTAYSLDVDNNIFSVSSQATNGNAILMGISNGACRYCSFNSNIIQYTTTTPGTSAAIADNGSGMPIVGNQLTINGGRYGISLTMFQLVSFATSVVADNKISFVNSTNAQGIFVIGSDPRQGPVVISNNQISGDNTASQTGIVFQPGGGSGLIVGNQISNMATGINLFAGSNPFIQGNICINVTTTTNCGPIGDLGAQNFTGAVTMKVLATPVLITPIASLTGGTLADATQFCYQVQARNASGYSAAATEKCVTTGTSGGTNSVLVAWTAVPGATTYAIYGRTTGTETHMAPDGNFTVTSFTDTGSITPSGAIAATMTAPSIITGSLIYTTIYSAAGTALPSCVSGNKGQTAVVSDATTPTFLTAYTSGGAVVSPVLCNGSGWVTY